MIRVQATTDMSRAIRNVIREYGGTVKNLDDDVLGQFVQILAAYTLDLKAEQDRRVASKPTSMQDSRYPITEVLWLDSAQLDQGNWMVLEEVEKYAGDLLQRSIGYAVADTETSLALARSISEWELDTVEKAEGVLCIPKACIVERR